MSLQYFAHADDAYLINRNGNEF